MPSCTESVAAGTETPPSIGGEMNAVLVFFQWVSRCFVRESEAIVANAH